MWALICLSMYLMPCCDGHYGHCPHDGVTLVAIVCSLFGIGYKAVVPLSFDRQEAQRLLDVMDVLCKLFDMEVNLPRTYCGGAGRNFPHTFPPCVQRL